MAKNQDTVDPGEYGLARSTVTLSGLLNAIDGVSSQEDCILFATTNHPDRLDSALSRPGRLNVQLSFEDATFDQAKALYEHFFPFSQSAESDESSLNSKNSILDEKENSKMNETIQSQDDLDKLSTEFANGIFNPTPSLPVSGEEEQDCPAEFSISMAGLQGYLLTYKKQPRLAASNAAHWSNEIRKQMKEKEQKRMAKRAEGRKVLKDSLHGTDTKVDDFKNEVAK
ncbi:uncharacterized protein I206_101617 [Kwoniella pini CBS 10737]|uniref:Uncharacterized protein n=1 Tax=Kwoniella pini CBS 10737 TaxID=1296096 RepID=A0A1B9HW64_9TREE|nr:uncharacterized protein I206_06413 [Kwoniella pini CBS 10737]OCF47512.1 hypothetical protein I206_06413 [Kwoniella pini CBS 10737]